MNKAIVCFTGDRLDADKKSAASGDGGCAVRAGVGGRGSSGSGDKGISEKNWL